MTICHIRGNGHLIALAHGRQATRVLIFLIRGFFIGSKESREGHDSSGGTERSALAVRCGGLHIHAHLKFLSIGHLRRNSALPNQVIKRELVTSEFASNFSRSAEDVTSGANCFVRFLCVLHLTCVHTWRFSDMVGAIESASRLPCCSNRRLRKRGRVGTHVGNEAVFIQCLSNAHGERATPTESTTGVLLHGRSGKRSLG